MHSRFRKSWPVKIVAVAFIVLILLGNVFFVQTMFGEEMPQWLRIIALMSILFLFFGGVTHLIHRVYIIVRGEHE